MPEKKLPSEIIEEIENNLERIQNTVTNASEHIGLARNIISAGKPYWEATNKIFKEGNPNTILTSGYQILESVSEEVKSLDVQSRIFQEQVESVAGSTTVFADATGSTASLSGYSLHFNTEPTKNTDTLSILTMTIAIKCQQ